MTNIAHHNCKAKHSNLIIFLTDKHFYTDIPVSFETRKILFYNAMDLFHEKVPVAHPVSHRKTPLAMTHTFV